MSPIHRGLKSKVGSVHNKGTQFQIIIQCVAQSCFSCHSTLLRCSMYSAACTMIMSFTQLQKLNMVC